MGTPYLSIHLDKIEHNARVVFELCSRHGIELTPVTKGVCGHPEVARAMLRGGPRSIADSRLMNLRRLRDAGITARMLLLRVPALSAVGEAAARAGISLNSDIEVLSRLSREAASRGRRHDVIIMVDLGDLREGAWPDEVAPLVRQALALPGLRVLGLGTNLSCFAGVMPTVENMRRFVQIAEEVESECSCRFRWLSGINSSGLELIAADRMPARVNHARIGEAILLGRETVHRRPWPGTHQDAFILHAEVLECRRKPSLPLGPRTEDAFGGTPSFEDRGIRQRALLNVGREDVDISTVVPLDPGVRIIGASSGYLAVDVTDAPRKVAVGQEMAFTVGYGALLRAMTSEYVEKRCLSTPAT